MENMNRRSEQSDSVFRLVVLGTGGVGKSALSHQLLYNLFSEDYEPTIEELYRKQVAIDNHACMLEILDTAGMEELSAMRDQYMRSGEGFVCVYDITLRQTWEELRDICNKVLQVQDEADVPMVIVGNKCDLGDALRQVTVAEGKELATTFHAQFYEASAKLGTNVEKCFFDLVRDIRQRRRCGPAPVVKPKRGCPLF